MNISGKRIYQEVEYIRKKRGLGVVEESGKEEEGGRVKFRSYLNILFKYTFLFRFEKCQEIGMVSTWVLSGK